VSHAAQRARLRPDLIIDAAGRRKVVRSDEREAKGDGLWVCQRRRMLAQLSAAMIFVTMGG
jgi:hypothetical protein